FELLLCHGTVCVVGKIRDLILQLSKSSIYSTKPSDDAQYIQRDYRQHGYIRVGDYSLSIFNLLSLNNRLNTIS
ncbi:hypothetical protein ACRW53_17410, partial [Escherichia coli]